MSDGDVYVGRSDSDVYVGRAADVELPKSFSAEPAKCAWCGESVDKPVSRVCAKCWAEARANAEVTRG